MFVRYTCAFIIILYFKNMEFPRFARVEEGQFSMSDMKTRSLTGKYTCYIKRA